MFFAVISLPAFKDIQVISCWKHHTEIYLLLRRVIAQFPFVTGWHSLFPYSCTRITNSFPRDSPALRAMIRTYRVPHSLLSFRGRPVSAFEPFRGTMFISSSHRPRLRPICLDTSRHVSFSRIPHGVITGLRCPKNSYLFRVLWQATGDRTPVLTTSFT